MKVSFQTPNHNFIAKFNESLCAKKILEKLPLDSSVSIGQDRVCFKINIDTLPGSEAALDKVTGGDVVYWPDIGYVCIFLSDITPKKDSSLGLVNIGRVEGNIDDFSQISAGDSIRVVSMGEEKEKKISTDSVPNPDRKLTQAEIDVLVQQLLAQKKKEQENKNK